MAAKIARFAPETGLLAPLQALKPIKIAYCRPRIPSGHKSGSQMP
jgi:hypothetical protein